MVDEDKTSADKQEGDVPASETMSRTTSQTSNFSSKYPAFSFDDEDRPTPGQPKKKKKDKSEKDSNSKEKSSKEKPTKEKTPKEKTKKENNKKEDKSSKKKQEKDKKEKIKPTKEDKKSKDKKENKKEKNDKPKKDNKKKDKNEKPKISEPIVTDSATVPKQEGAKDLASGSAPNGSVVNIDEGIESNGTKNKKNDKKDKKSKTEKPKTDKENKNEKSKDKSKKDEKKPVAKKRGRSKSSDKSKNKPPAKKGKKRDPSLTSRDTDDATNSALDDISDFTDASSFYSDFTSEDESKKSKKNKKKKKKTKKKSKKGKGKKSPGKKEDGKRRDSATSKDSAIVITDDEDEPKPGEGKTILGCIRIPGKHEPVVYSCCGCCSLGAGSLLTALIFMGLSAGYVAYRAGLYKTALQTSYWVFWSGKSLMRDVWKVELIIGMITASLAGLASLLLLTASCLWGQKEHYNRIRRCIIIWILCVGLGVLNNIAEVIYIQAMPEKLVDTDGVSKSTKDLKESLGTLWALTSIFLIFYVYLCIVLYSYIRLLRYMNAPKIGEDISKKEDSEAPTPTSSRNPSLQANKDRGLSRSTTSLQLDRERRTSLQRETIRERQLADIRTSADKREENPQKRAPIKSSKTNETGRREQVYENWGYSSDQESYPSQPITRRNSASSEIADKQPKPKPRKNNFREAFEDDADDADLLNRINDPVPKRRMKPLAKTNSVGGSNGRAEPIYENQKKYLKKETPKELKPTPTTVKRLSSELDPERVTYENSVPFGRVELETPRMRSSSNSLQSSPPHLYDMPPTYTELELLFKKNNGDAGSQSDIREMSRLAEQLQKEQEELDKTGHCDPAKAENLTRMAMSALRLSEKILQDVKAGHGNLDSSAPSSAAVSRTTSMTEAESAAEQKKNEAKDFIYKLSETQPKTGDPMEEMFRLFGKDLVKQHPDKAHNFMKYYLQNQQQHPSSLPDISSAVQSETQPWQTILNPSEALPGKSFQPQGDPFTVTIPPPPVSEIGAGFIPVDPSHANPLNLNQRTQSAFTPTHAQTLPNQLQSSASNFHPIQPNKHTQSLNPGNRPLFPVEFPLQNSPSFKPEPANFPPNNQMMPQHQQQQFRPHHPSFNPNHGSFPRSKQQQHPQYPPHGHQHPRYPYHHQGPPGKRNMPQEDPYTYSDCPYSCCYDPYGDYGSIYGPYTDYGTDSMYGDESYRGRDPKWYPTGMDYSIYGSSYYPSHSFWETPNRHEGSMPYPHRPSFRAEEKSTSKRPDSRKSSKPAKRKDIKSKSLPDLLDEDLYSDSRFGSSIAPWEEQSNKGSIGRTSSKASSVSRRAQSRSSSANSGKKSSNDEYLKGYKAALREALLSMNNDDVSEFDKEDLQDKFLENFIAKSKSSRRQPSFSDDKFSRKSSKQSRRRDDDFSPDESVARGRRRGKVGAQQSKLISFRPSNRPGAKLVGDDLFDDYRTVSLVPSNRPSDDFVLTRRSKGVSRSNSERLSSKKLEAWELDDIDGFSEFSREDAGRPINRVRSGGNMSRDAAQERRPASRNQNWDRSRRSSVSSIPSEYTGKPHVYNTLDRDNATETGFESDRPHQQKDQRPQSRNTSRGRSDTLESRDRNTSRMDDDHRDVKWFMGDDTDEPLYGSEYNGLWDEPVVERGRPLKRNNTQPIRSSSQGVPRSKSQRFESGSRSASSEGLRRKVTFGNDRDKRPRL